MDPLTCTPTNSNWLFLAGAAEPRHLQDIVFGVHALRKRGVPDSRIFVYTDQPAAKLHLDPFGVPNQLPLADFLAHTKSLPSAEVAVLVASGHGNPQGIPVDGASPTNINPTQLLQAVRACPGIRAGAILLGQCYAGLFNYTNAGVPDGIHLCLLGATSLSLSLSSPTLLPAPLPTVDGSPPLTDWTANVFVVKFFEWMLAPTDVDGDGRYTMMDAFKHASIVTSGDLKGVKAQAHAFITTQYPRFAQLQLDRAAAKDPAMQRHLDLQIAALDKGLSERLENLYVHQEGWVLHARLAAALELFPPAPSAP